MRPTDSVVTLEEVVKLARQLSTPDKKRLIERVAPEIEREVVTGQSTPSVSLLGLLRDAGPAPSAEEIDEARREAWSSFPRSDI